VGQQAIEVRDRDRIGEDSAEGLQLGDIVFEDGIPG
jgi:hypothetical protein